MDAKLLTALYETKRQNFLIGFTQNPDRFDPALAFAYYHRMAPIFHESDIREKYAEDPFSELYSVSADFANQVTKYLDKNWTTPNGLKNVSFYDLEEKFGGYKANRMELLFVIEYSRISRRFDDALYDAVASNAPVEASTIDATFSPNDVYFN